MLRPRWGAWGRSVISFAPQGPKGDAEGSIDASLTLRAPTPYRIKSATVDGKVYTHFNPSKETLKLPDVPKGTDVVMHVVVTYIEVGSRP